MHNPILTRRIWIMLGWVLVIGVIYLSLSSDPQPAPIRFSDKIGHFTAYAILMGWWHQIDRNAYRLALLFILMGLSLEILQSFTGYRQADILDMAANAVGVGIGWFIARFALGWSTRRLAP